MAFCDKCGAYIPDGQTACLACGYDEKESARVQQEQAAAAAAREQEKQHQGENDTGKYYSFSNDELREKLEQQRRKQQETSRKWAEQEKARREQAYKVYEGETFRSSGEKAAKAVGEFAKNSKWLAALSYVGILFALPFLFNKDDKFSVYHAKQGAVLFLYSILCRLLGFLPLVGAVLKLFKWFCIYKGMSNSVNGIMQPLPYIGQLGDKF